MAIAYAVTSLIALILIVPSCTLGNKRNVPLILMSVSAFVANAGWLLTTLADTLEIALMANRLAYLGNVCLPLCLLLLIGEQCGVRFRPKVRWALIAVSLGVFLIASSPGYSTVYYRTVEFAVVNGSGRLLREYGPLHSVYYLYLLGYICCMLGVILYGLRRRRGSNLQMLFLLTVVLGNVMIWFVEQFVPREFEFLSISYLISEAVLQLLYGILAQQTPQPVAVAGNAGSEPPELKPEPSPEPEEPKPEEGNPQPILQTEPEEAPDLTPERVEGILQRCEEEYRLSPREKDVLRCLLSSKKRKEIAEELFVTESTIKKYTTQIYRKFGVSNRMELYWKVNQGK